MGSQSLRTMSTSNNASPIITYDNVERDNESILKENKGKSGIYRWVHIEPGKCYIGSARYYSTFNKKDMNNEIKVNLTPTAIYHDAFLDKSNILRYNKNKTRSDLIS